MAFWIIRLLVRLVIYNFTSKFDTSDISDTSENKISTISSVDEAIAAVACIEQGLLPDTLQRDPISTRGAFLDKDGNSWDVKTLKTHSILGSPIFNPYNISRTIKKELDKVNKNLILSIADLPEQEEKTVYKVLRLLPSEKLERIIIVNKEKPEKSKTSAQLLQFLEN